MEKNEDEKVVKLNPNDMIDYLNQPLKPQYHESAEEKVITNQIEKRIYDITWQIDSFQHTADGLIQQMKQCKEWCEQLVRIRFDNADLLKDLMDRQNKFEHVYNEFANSLIKVDRNNNLSDSKLDKLRKEIDQMLINETPESGDLVIIEDRFGFFEIGIYYKEHVNDVILEKIHVDEYIFAIEFEENRRSTNIVVLEKQFDDLNERFYGKVITGNA